MGVSIADLNVEQLIAPVQDLEHADTRTCMWVIVQECTAGLSLSFCWWEVGRISGKLKHSPAQRKTALRSCGPWWRHSWLRLWTQSGPTRTARVPLRNRFPANTHKKRGSSKCYIHNKGDCQQKTQTSVPLQIQSNENKVIIGRVIKLLEIECYSSNTCSLGLAKKREV